MDSIKNPYTPSAGRKPAAFVGREKITKEISDALERLRLGGSSQNYMLVGLRGVGKTVLLQSIFKQARSKGYLTIELEIVEGGKSLPEILVPELRTRLLQMDKVEAAKEAVTRAKRALAGFLKHVKFSYEDWDIQPLLGLADSGQLDYDLKELLVAVGEAAQAAQTILVLFIDELHSAPKDELTALIYSLHKCAQEGLPVLLVGAGLPQLRAVAAEAKSYTERMFLYTTIDALDEASANDALTLPAQKLDVSYTSDALSNIFKETQGYPYFIQEWGATVWDLAEGTPITLADTIAAKAAVQEKLDDSFYRVRFDRLTDAEKRYMHTMAKQGEKPAYKSGDIARSLGKNHQGASNTRDSLIKKGMIYAPSYGEVAFTVPLFGAYLLRELGR